MSTEDETEGVFDCEVSPERLKYLRECAEKSIQAESRLTRLLSRLEELAKKWEADAIDEVTGSVGMCAAELRASLKEEK